MSISGQLERYPPSLVRKWLLLPLISGCVNAGSFLACARLVTHVTGAVTSTGLAVEAANWRNAAGVAAVPLCFLIGVVTGAYFTDARIARGRTPHYGLAVNMAAAVLLVAALAGHFDLFGPFGHAFELPRDFLLLALLCSASGMINAVMTSSSRGLLRATHMTGTTTDIGLALARIFFGHAPGRRHAWDVYQNWLRVGTLVAFAIGAVIGAGLFTLAGYLGFLLPCALALGAANIGAQISVTGYPDVELRPQAHETSPPQQGANPIPAAANPSVGPGRSA